MTPAAGSWHEHFLQDRFAALAGIVLEEAGPGHARASLIIGPQHLNAANVAHGGALFTLADFAAAVASNAHGREALAISTSSSFLRAARAGRVVAEAREVSCGERLASYDVEVRCEGELVATVQVMVYRRPSPP